MTEFKDFWSRNGWLCQCYYNREIVTNTVCVPPLSKPPYHISDRYKNWTVEKLEKWVNHLDNSTLFITALPEANFPALDLRLFPCADGNWYAAWPPMPENQPGQLYVRIYTFLAHPYWRPDDWYEKHSPIAS